MKKLGFLFIILFIICTVLYIFFNKPDNEFVENDLYTEIMQRGYIKVGINTNLKPFGYYDENGKITGYDAELYILKDSSRVKFIPVTVSNRLIKASGGEVDIVISTVTITPQRQEVVSFSIPYEFAEQALLVKSSSNIKDLHDIGSHSVGVILGTIAEKNIQRLVPSAHIRSFNTYGDAYLALKAGEVVAITSDDNILNRYTLADNEVTLLPSRYSHEPYGIAFKKGAATERLKSELDSAIKDLKRRNILFSMRKRWGLGN